MAAIVITRADSLTIRSLRDSTTDTTAVDQDSADTNTMSATGSGRGDFRLYVDPRTGALFEATGTSRTDIVVATGSSRFPFHEEARQTITLLQ